MCEESEDEAIVKGLRLDEVLGLIVMKLREVRSELEAKVSYRSV